MPNEIKLPALGENVDSGTVVKILVSRGDKIKKDQPILELETEKASLEVPSSAEGIVEDIRIHEGDTIHVGQVLFTLDGNDPAAERRPPAAPAGQTAPPAETAEKKPAPAKEPSAPADTSTASERIAQPAPAERRPPERAVESPRDRETAPAAPSTRLLARELGIDIDAVTGTGPDARISEDDVRNYARSIILNASSGRAAAEPEKQRTDFSRWGEIEEKAMTPIRRRIASHVHEAWTTIPHVTHFESADITDLEDLRKRFAPKAVTAGGKLTITAIALKVAAVALKVFPEVNTSLDSETGKIVYKKYYHLGIAVDTDMGLLVPVIRNADKKGILELSVELNQLAEKARNNKLSPQEMQGGTFTITNLGGIGGVGFTPIVNSPEAAILGISRASHQPVYSNGEFKPRLMLPLALSYDHRLIDGAGAARFLAWIREALESPFMLALEG